jgi:hypothetical protein
MTHAQHAPLTVLAMIALAASACTSTTTPGPADASTDAAPAPAGDAASSGDAAGDAASLNPLINSCGAYYQLNPDNIPAQNAAFCLENVTNHQVGNCCVSDSQCADNGAKCCPWGQTCTGPDSSCECYVP